MSNSKKNEELQSRREFFKQAAKAARPVVGAAIMASVPFVKSEAATSGCDYSCSGSCSRGCQGSCQAYCKDDCTGNCSGFCKGSCGNNCNQGCSVVAGSNPY